MISVNKEDYLRAFYLQEEKGEKITVTETADYMDVSKASVSEMLKKLVAKGLINYERYSDITLTLKGKNFARKLTARHRLIEYFLRETLKMDESEIHEEAHRLEHAFSDVAIEKLRIFLGDPKKDPHGEPIPR